MGLRGTSSINVVRLNSSNAPNGVATFTITYVWYDVNGRPKYVDPTKIEVRFTAPSGDVEVGTYPRDSADSPSVEVHRLWEGHYAASIALGTRTGRWKMKVITNDGLGPGTELEFQVVSVS